MLKWLVRRALNREITAVDVQAAMERVQQRARLVRRLELAGKTRRQLEYYAINLLHSVTEENVGDYTGNELIDEVLDVEYPAFSGGRVK